MRSRASGKLPSSDDDDDNFSTSASAPFSFSDTRAEATFPKWSPLAPDPAYRKLAEPADSYWEAEKPRACRCWSRNFERSALWALRTSVAGFLGASIIAQTHVPVLSWIAAPTLVPVYAIFSVGDSLGATFRSVYNMATGTLYGAAWSTILHAACQLGAGIPVVIVLLLLSIFIISYVDTNKQRRLLASTNVVISLVRLTIQPRAPVYYPLMATLSVFLALACAVITIIPPPYFARKRVDGRLVDVARAASAAFTEVLSTFHTPGQLEHRTRARLQEHALDTRMARLKEFIEDARYECGPSLVAVDAMVDAIDKMVLLLKALHKGVAAVKPSVFHERFEPYLRDPLLQITEEMEMFLRQAAREASHPSGTLSGERLRVASRKLLQAFRSARFHLYYERGALNVNEQYTLEETLGQSFLLFTVRECVENAARLETAFNAEKRASCSRKRCCARLPFKTGVTLAWRKPDFVVAGQIAVGTVVGCLPLVIPSAQELQYFSLWTPLTVLILVDSTLGASVHKSFLRLQGTVMGAVGAYGLSILAQGDVYAKLFLMMVLVLGLAIGRADKTNGYASTVGASTVGIVMFGNQNPDLTYRDYAERRIMQTLLGVVIALAVTLVRLGPGLAATLANTMDTALAEAATTIAVVPAALFEKSAAQATKDHLSKAKSALSSLDTTTAALALEPRLWGRAVPKGEQYRVNGALARLKESLDWLVHSATCLAEFRIEPGETRANDPDASSAEMDDLTTLRGSDRLRTVILVPIELEVRCLGRAVQKAAQELRDILKMHAQGTAEHSIIEADASALRHAAHALADRYRRLLAEIIQRRADLAESTGPGRKRVARFPVSSKGIIMTHSIVFALLLCVDEMTAVWNTVVEMLQAQMLKEEI